jgi:uridine kinase
MSTKIVAVDGAGGAGKTTIAEELASLLGGAQIVHTDDFASWDNPVDWWPGLIAKVLEPLAHNRTGQFEPTRWAADQPRRTLEVQPAEFLVLEGVSASREAFRPYLTYSIWVETPAQLRLERGLERDGQDAREQWLAWMAEEEAYRQRERPDLRADLVIGGTYAI